MKNLWFILMMLCANIASSQTRPNILLIVSDDQRPDTISALGNPHISTPNLDGLVREGTAFLNATCSNPICTPSRAEILTGSSGFVNGVRDFGGKIDPDLRTLPKVLQAQGYDTIYVGKWHNNGRPNLHGYSESVGLYAGGGGKWYKPQKDWKDQAVTGYRGWIFQDDAGNKFPDKGVGLTPDISDQFADAAIEVLKRNSQNPFFLHVNFTAPHDPLLVPTGFERKYPAGKLPLFPNYLPKHPFDHGNYEGRDEKMLPWPRTKEMVKANLGVYYAVIHHMDLAIGRMLKVLQQSGQADNTMVIYTSDHGLAVGSHGLMGKQNMYEHTIRVPMIFSGKRVPKGQRSEALCYLRDLCPTILEYAGIHVPCEVEGRSLMPVIQKKSENIYSEVYGYFRDKQRMIRTDQWKLIHYPHLDRYQLFDLKNDPFEKSDLIAEAQHRKVLQNLKQKLTLKFREWEATALKDN